MEGNDQGMKLGFQDLVMIIGQQAVDIKVLQQQLAMAQKVIADNQAASDKKEKK